MLGTSVAKAVSDLDAVVELVKTVSDPVKLQAIRDELKSLADAQKKQEKAALDKIKQAEDSIAVNQVSHNALQKWENDLKIKKDALDAKEKDVLDRLFKLTQAEKELKTSLKSLESDKLDFTNTKARMLYSVENLEKETQEKINQKMKELQKREDLVSVRENKVSLQETNFFKKSQLVSQLVDSLK